MTARERSKELQQAKSQKVQETVHQVLYCDTDWNEHEMYGRRFAKIMERSQLDDPPMEIDEEVAKEFGKRVKMKLGGKEPLDKSLVFYRILNVLHNGTKTADAVVLELDANNPECVLKNLACLEESGFIECVGGSYKLTGQTKKFLLKQK